MTAGAQTGLKLPAWLVRMLVGGEVPAGDGALSLVFERPIPAWAWLLIGLAALGIAWWSYRRLAGATRGSTRVVRGGLVVLRTLTLLLVVLLISGPSLRFARERVERDGLLVLVDRSRSLAIADAPGGVSRDEEASAFLRAAEPTLAEISRTKDIEFVGFAEGAFALEKARGEGSGDAEAAKDSAGKASLRPVLGELGGNSTDLDGAIRQALSLRAGRPLSGVVVVSDGRSATPVSGESLRVLERDSTPVFAVALGSRQRVGDAAIVAVGAPARAFVRDRVPVEVRLDRGGVAGALTVRLVDASSGAEIARREVPDRGDAQAGEETVVLDGAADSAGSRAWRVEIVSERPDLVRENDVREVPVEFVDRAIRVLYIEGSSRWEYRYFKNLLLREKDLDSSIMLLSADRDFAQEGNMAITRLPRTKEEFGAYDLFVIGDVPSGFFSPDQLAILRGEVSERGAGLLWIGGERATPSSWEGTLLADLFPFKPPLSLEPRVGASLLRPTETASRLGVLRLSDDSESGWPAMLSDTALEWPRLRYVQSIPRSRLKPTAEVLADALGVGATAQDASAAVLRMRFGAGEIVFVGTDEIWRWRYGQGERYPERFWIPLVRLLARESLVAGDRRATLAAMPSRIAPGESTVVRLGLSDEETAAKTPGVVPVSVLDAQGELVSRLELAREGSEASAVLPGDRAGRFTLVADDPAFGRVSATLDVVRRDDELRRGDADHEALEELVRRTGGRMLDGASVAELARLLPQRARVSDESVVRSIWDTAIAFGAVVALLCVEWIGRRMLRLV